MKNLILGIAISLCMGAATRQMNLPAYDVSADKTKLATIGPSGTVDWRFGTGAILNVRDFGAVPDDGLDDAPAINAAAKSLGSSGSARGGQLLLPRGTYRLSSPIRLSRQEVLVGDGGAGNQAATILQPDKNITGIIVDGPATSTDGGRGDYSVIRDLSIQYAAQTTGLWTAQHAYALGDTVTYRASTNLWAVFVCTTAGTSGSSEPTFASLTEFANEGSTVSDGSVVWTARIVAGVRMRARALLENFYVLNSPGNGVHISGSTGATPSTNANGWIARNGRISFAALNSLYVAGSDANAGNAFAIDTELSVRGWGFYDSSFLGNTYTGTQAAEHYLGAYGTDLTNFNARNVYLGCYSESGEPASQIQRPGVVIGGGHGAGFSSNAQAAIFAENAISSSAAFTFKWTGGGSKNTEFYAPYADGVPFAFTQTTTGGTFYSMERRGTMFGGTHDWRFSANSSDSQVAFDLSGSDSSVTSNNPGHIGFPQGIWFYGAGPKATLMRTTNASPSASEPFQLPTGSIWWNNSPLEQSTQTGGILGWEKVHQAVYSAGADYFTIRTPHFGQANTKKITSTVASPYAISFLDEAGVTFVNDQASAMVGLKLPAISTSVFSMRTVEFSFFVTDPDGLRVLSFDSSRKVQWGNHARADYLQSTAPGSFLRLKAEFDDSAGTPTFTVIEASGVWTDSNGLTLNPASGPVTAATGNLVSFADSSGSVYQDAGLPVANVVTVSRAVNAGAGLSGGGTLTSDISLSLASTIAQAETFSSTVNVQSSLTCGINASSNTTLATAGTVIGPSLVSGGTANQAGSDLNISAGSGKGNGTPPRIVFAVPFLGASGSGTTAPTGVARLGYSSTRGTTVYELNGRMEIKGPLTGDGTAGFAIIEMSGANGNQINFNSGNSVISFLQNNQFLLKDANGTHYIEFNPTVGSENLMIPANLGYTIPTVLAPTGTTQTVAWKSGVTQKISLASATGNVTLTLNNPVDGGRYKLIVLQGAVSRNLVWPANVKWPGGTAPTITVTNGKVDVIDLDYVSAVDSYYGRFSQNY